MIFIHVLRSESFDVVTRRPLRTRLVEADGRDLPRQTYRYERVRGNPEPPTLGHLLVEGETLTFRIDERRRQIDHVLTDEEKARKRRGEYVYMPRWDYVPTGELRLHVSRPDAKYAYRTWKDGVRTRVEALIASLTPHPPDTRSRANAVCRFAVAAPSAAVISLEAKVPG